MKTGSATLAAENAPVVHESIRVLLGGSAAYCKAVRPVLQGNEIALVDVSESPEAVVEKILRGGLDCIVVDSTVGSRSSLDLHQTIALNVANPPPMILLEETATTSMVLKAFRSGISDCVSRDHDFAGELLTAIRQAVARGRKTRLLQDQVEQLTRGAQYDHLTGLPNQNFLNERLLNLIATGERHGASFSIFLIDINNFKQLNDLHGQVIGSQAVRAFATQLQLTSRSSDTVGRVHGDEFLYLVDRGVTDEAVELTRSRLAEALSFSVQLDALDLVLSPSIGAAIFPADGKTSEDLLKAARQRKRSSRSRSSAAKQSPPPKIEIRAGQRAEDRRTEHRNRVFKRGRIVIGDGYSTIDCVVRDLSVRGAQLSVEEQIMLPLEFAFAVLSTGSVHSATLRWQKGRSLGIEFKV